METHRAAFQLFGAGGAHQELHVVHRVATKKGTCKEEDRRGRRGGLDLTCLLYTSDAADE